MSFTRVINIRHSRKRTTWIFRVALSEASNTDLGKHGLSTYLISAKNKNVYSENEQKMGQFVFICRAVHF